MLNNIQEKPKSHFITDKEREIEFAYGSSCSKHQLNSIKGLSVQCILQKIEKIIVFVSLVGGQAKSMR